MRVRYQKNGTLQFYESECLPTVPHEPPPVLTGPFERCADCPYPGHGFLCWGADGETCMRTKAARIMERDNGCNFCGSRIPWAPESSSER